MQFCEGATIDYLLIHGLPFLYDTIKVRFIVALKAT
jgi:hypothetical protein